MPERNRTVIEMYLSRNIFGKLSLTLSGRLKRVRTFHVEMDAV